MSKPIPVKKIELSIEAAARMYFCGDPAFKMLALQAFNFDELEAYKHYSIDADVIVLHEGTGYRVDVGYHSVGIVGVCDRDLSISSNQNILPTFELAESYKLLPRVLCLVNMYNNVADDTQEPESVCIVRDINGHLVIVSEKMHGSPRLLTFRDAKRAEFFLYNFSELINKCGDFI